MYRRRALADGVGTVSSHPRQSHGTAAGELWCAKPLMPLEGIKTISNLRAPLVVVVYVSLEHHIFGKSKPAVVSVTVLCSVVSTSVMIFVSSLSILAVTI
jgi:hypothetical protein